MDDYDALTGADEYFDGQYDDHDADLLVDDPIGDCEHALCWLSGASEPHTRIRLVPYTSAL